MKMLSAALVTILLLISSSPAVAEPPQAQGEWVPLFNGKNLDGWIPKITGYDPGDNFGDTFRVEDGILKVCYDQYDRFDGRFGHLFHERTFSHYLLRVEYRFVGEQLAGGPGWAYRNSGIMLHGQPAETMRKDQDFPVSIEAQLLGGGGQGDRSTANVCTPGTHIVMDGELITRHCINSSSKTYHGDQWVTVLLEIRGNDTSRFIIDGETVFEYEKPQLDLNDADAKRLLADGDQELMIKQGSISLQSESHPVEFRKVEIMILDE